MLRWAVPVPLNDDEVNKIPRLASGVYLLHAFSRRTATLPVIYAGQTDDLRRRLYEHLDYSSAKPMITLLRRVEDCCFSVALVADLVTRARIESGLIRGLRPVCNTQVPHIAPIFPPLPLLHLSSRPNP